MKRHLLLVGLSGSGKTTVGCLAAQALGARFVDIDEVIEAAERLPISHLFAHRGEAAFRELERDEVTRALDGEPGVLAPGAGWAAESGNLEAAAGRALVIYLRTDPAVAVARAASEGNRPLLAGDHPEGRMRELLASRHAFYEAAEAVVDTDHRSVSKVAEDLVELARSRAGW